ncbi:hypothetical protein EVAR_36483_1 [Eumeta japonica]|uniref:Uncharacterized protein n=1 Tax=Eumeta variegata TaxID=151549 RepID=A0A4C1WVX1_EUMVA|nr:hypothetical protein EVAR_36483_1 [Eumeta japonica]
MVKLLMHLMSGLCASFEFSENFRPTNACWKIAYFFVRIISACSRFVLDGHAAVRAYPAMMAPSVFQTKSAGTSPAAVARKIQNGNSGTGRADAADSSPGDSISDAENFECYGEVDKETASSSENGNRSPANPLNRHSWTRTSLRRTPPSHQENLPHRRWGSMRQWRNARQSPGLSRNPSRTERARYVNSVYSVLRPGDDAAADGDFDSSPLFAGSSRLSSPRSFDKLHIAYTIYLYQNQSKANKLRSHKRPNCVHENDIGTQGISVRSGVRPPAPPPPAAARRPPNNLITASISQSAIVDCG